MKSRRRPAATLCEACESKKATPLKQPEPWDDFQLCGDCRARLDRASLRPLEWYNLAKRYTPDHNRIDSEFYSQRGEALHSEDELEEEEVVLPAPVLKDVAHDLDLLWDYSLTRRTLGSKVRAAWRRHPKADVAACLTRAWERRKDAHARDCLLTICGVSAGKAGAELVRQIWKEVELPSAPPKGKYFAEEIALTRLVQTHLGEKPDDFGLTEEDDDDDDNSRPGAGTQSGSFMPNSELVFATSRCLPADESFRRVCEAVEQFHCPMLFIQLRDARVLDWIETHIQPPIIRDWGKIAAPSGFSWERAVRWLEGGRPLSLVALDALSTLISTYGEPYNAKEGVRLLSPPSRRTLSRVLKDHVERDPVPRVEREVDFILSHTPVLLEGKPFI